MRSQRIIGVLAALVFLIAVGAAGVWCHGKRPDSRKPPLAAAAVSGRDVSAAGERPKQAPLPTASDGLSRKQQQVPVTKSQKAHGEMRDLVASGKVKEALAVAYQQLIKCEDAAVRSETVVALSRIGFKALPELSEMLLDEDPAVKRQAFVQWKAIASGMPDQSSKSQVLQAALLMLSDPDSLRELVDVVSDMPRPMALRGLVSVIDSENPQAAVFARDRYRHLTGEPYTTPQAAEKWINEHGATQIPAPTR